MDIIKLFNGFNKYVYYFLILIITILFTLAMINWQGSIFSYSILTFASLSLLYYSFIFRPGSGFTFYTLAVFTGYWVKLSLHVIDRDLIWMEPVGFFNFSFLQWSEVAKVSFAGILGTLFGGIFGLFILRKKYINTKKINFQQNYIYISIFSIVMIGLTIFINEYYNIVHASIPPHYLNIPWPLQGLFNWYIAGPCFFVFMLPLWFSSRSKSFLKLTCILLISSMLVSISIYSRGIVFFQAVIIILSIYCYRKEFPFLNNKMVIKIFVCIFLCISLTAVLSGLRRELFIYNVVSQQPSTPASTTPASTESALTEPAVQQPQTIFLGLKIPSIYSLKLVLKLPIERWIGLEGVMAVVGYQGRSQNLFWNALFKKRIINEVDWYTSTIALSPSNNAANIMYATPPGLFAYCYYSGSYILVSLVAFLIASIIVVSERIIYVFTKNPFLASSLGVGLAIQVIHIGSGSLYMMLVIYIMNMFLALILQFIINIINNKKICNLTYD